MKRHLVLLRRNVPVQSNWSFIPLHWYIQSGSRHSWLDEVQFSAASVLTATPADITDSADDEFHCLVASPLSCLSASLTNTRSPPGRRRSCAHTPLLQVYICPFFSLLGVNVSVKKTNKKNETKTSIFCDKVHLCCYNMRGGGDSFP